MATCLRALCLGMSYFSPIQSCLNLESFSWSAFCGYVTTRVAAGTPVIPSPTVLLRPSWLYTYKWRYLCAAITLLSHWSPILQCYMSSIHIKPLMVAILSVQVQQKSATLPSMILCYCHLYECYRRLFICGMKDMQKLYGKCIFLMTKNRNRLLIKR